jgi:predicted short-subunit dehydrogenase-like oxidoreductase (DUF2520 family)
MTQTQPSITIIGRGAVGSALSDAFRYLGYSIVSEWTQNEGTLWDLETGKKQIQNRSLPHNENEIGDWVFITTPDDQISKVCEELSELSLDWSQHSVIHCSGGLSSDVCILLSGKGAKTASMHPIQTFTRTPADTPANKSEGRKRIEDITISLEGDDDLTKLLENFVKQLGANPLRIDAQQKQQIHLSAVFASNYMVSLMATAERILKEAGIEEGLQILHPLISQTLANIIENGPAGALTGPISRGDVSTVNAHLENVTNQSDRQLYQILGRRALNLAKQSGKISDDQLQELKKLLE